MKLISNVVLSICLISIVLFSIGLSHASSGSNYRFTQNVNQTVIITTGINDIDTFSAYPLADLAGIQVIAINGTTITSSFAQNLSAQGIKYVILLGGPAVISNSSLTILESAGLNVTRIWGVTAVQTALELTQYIAPNSAFKCAVFSYYNESPNMNFPYHEYASIRSARNKCLFFPTYFSYVPAYVISYLQQAGITNVTYVGPKPLNRAQLGNLTGFNVTQVTGNFSSTLDNISQLNPRTSQRFLIVGEANNDWNNSMVLGSMPALNSSFAMVYNVSAQMPGIIATIKSGNFSLVRVVGEPSIVTQINQYLMNNGIVASTSEGRGLGLNLDVLSKFRDDMHESARYYKPLFNVTINPNIIGQMINKTFEEIITYNNTLQQITQYNNTIIPSLYTMLNKTYSLTQDANGAFSSGNYTSAAHLIIRAINLLHTGLYDSMLEGALKNDSLEVSRSTENEQTNHLKQSIDTEISSINSTLTQINSSKLFSNLSLNISGRIGSISNLLSELKSCAQQNNATCVTNLAELIREKVSELKSSVASSGLDTHEDIPGIGSVGSVRTNSSQNLSSARVIGLENFKIINGTCNSSGLFLPVSDVNEQSYLITNASLVYANISVPSSASAVPIVESNSRSADHKSVLSVFPAMSPTLPYNLTLDTTTTFVFNVNCMLAPQTTYFILLKYSRSTEDGVSENHTAWGRVYPGLTTYS